MELNENNSEKVCYDIPHYPVYIRRGLLSHYLNYSAPNHWHDDIELIAVLSGEMEYSVNGEILALKKGQGLLVNAGQMHFGFSRKKTECDFICILLHPMLLSPLPSFEQDFILPVIRNQNFPYLFLHEETSWERAIYEKALYLYNIRKEKTAPLKILAGFAEIWELLYENISVDKDRNKNNIHENQDLNIVKKMAEFINNNYMEKLSLADIAAAGAVGQSKCCKLFARFFFQTPTMYLTQHRLTKSMELLLNTDLPVIEIALSVGFGSASYYTETFRKWIGKTPSEFRKEGKFHSQ
ncbi:MAG TPA: AraC family transcriptional regulator [Candidatus Blautia ornithocaccae]|nr:AraC family transcriptional regulator [Candidatus Blautia ornithocaccae]